MHPLRKNLLFTVILFLSACASQEEIDQERAQVKAQADECLSRAGIFHLGYSWEQPRCVLEKEQQRLDLLEMECVRSGGRPIYTLYSKTETRVYDNCGRPPSTQINTAPAQPIFQFKPYCPPSQYPIYGCN